MNSFIQLLIQGLALGFTYGLLALGFAVVFRASGILNFAQGAMLLIGAYLVSYMTVDVSIPFFVAVLVACVLMTAAGVSYHKLLLRRLPQGGKEFVPIMATLGTGIALTAAVEIVFGSQQRILGDPWGATSVQVGDYSINWMKLWTIVAALVVLGGYFYFDRCTTYGLAVRAAAADEEAAAAVGVPVERLHAITWALAGSLAVLSGVFLSGFPNTPTLTLGDAALRAFPAVVIGGLSSPPGAVLGGLVVGMAEIMAAGYAPGWMGTDFSSVAPYFAMMLILLVRPYGVFGSAPVVRA